MVGRADRIGSDAVAAQVVATVAVDVHTTGGGVGVDAAGRGGVRGRRDVVVVLRAVLLQQTTEAEETEETEEPSPSEAEELAATC